MYVTKINLFHLPKKRWRVHFWGWAKCVCVSLSLSFPMMCILMIFSKASPQSGWLRKQTRNSCNRKTTEISTFLLVQHSTVDTVPEMRGASREEEGRELLSGGMSRIFYTDQESAEGLVGTASGRRQGRKQPPSTLFCTVCSWWSFSSGSKIEAGSQPSKIRMHSLCGEGDFSQASGTFGLPPLRGRTLKVKKIT